MKRRAIKFIKEFRFQAYGEHVIPAGTDHRLPINHLRQAVITVGHGTEVYVPPEYFIRVKKPPLRQILCHGTPTLWSKTFITIAVICKTRFTT